MHEGVNAGPDEVLERLFHGAAGHDAFETEMAPLARTIAKGNNGQQLRAWWVARMLYSPHPVAEKLTLFWHNHFATSNAKVNNAGFMLGQYELLRRHALGNFAELLQGISRDPAMLVWLEIAAKQEYGTFRPGTFVQ